MQSSDDGKESDALTVRDKLEMCGAISIACFGLFFCFHAIGNGFPLSLVGVFLLVISTWDLAKVWRRYRAYLDKKTRLYD